MKITLNELRGLIRETAVQEMAMKTSRPNKSIETKKFLMGHIERIWDLIAAGHGSPELEAQLLELQRALDDLYASLDGSI
jgi:hypothetical protein